MLAVWQAGYKKPWAGFPLSFLVLRRSVTDGGQLEMDFTS